MAGGEVRRQQLRMRHNDLSQVPAAAVPAGYELRNWRDGDEVELLPIFVECFGPSEWSEERILDTLPRCGGITRESIFVVVGPQGDVAGTASAWDNPKWPEDGYLHYVAVASAHRGRGLGTVASVAALEYMREAFGRRSAVLETDDNRLAALETYFRLGFEPIIEDEALAERWELVRRALGRSSDGGLGRAD